MTDDNVIDFGQVRFERGFTANGCLHRRIAYDTSLEATRCADCGTPIGTFRALMTLLQNWRYKQQRIDRQLEQLRDLEKKHVVLKAAKAAESAWRKKKLVPCCPHCREAIFPEDGFGDDFISKQIAREKRKRKADAKGQNDPR